MFWRLILPLLASVPLACAGGADVEPLASSADAARPFVEGQLAAHKVPVALARALPSGMETPVFALTLHDRDVVGFQFEMDARYADFHAHGLRRLAARLSPEEPAAVWVTPADEEARRRLAVMTVMPRPWRVLWAAHLPEAVDPDLVESLLDASSGPRATLHEVGSDRVILEFDQPAEEHLELVLGSGVTDARQAQVAFELSQRRLTLPVP